MPQPNLLHPIPVQIQQLDRSNTEYDNDMREPIQQCIRTSVVTIPGQIQWENDKKFSSYRLGPEENSDGYVLFRLVDLTDAGITIKREDKFIKFGNYDVDVYVVALKPVSHYPDQNGYTLIRAYFSDRQPSRVQSL